MFVCWFSGNLTEKDLIIIKKIINRLNFFKDMVKVVDLNSHLINLDIKEKNIVIIIGYNKNPKAYLDNDQFLRLFFNQNNGIGISIDTQNEPILKIVARLIVIIRKYCQLDIDY